jgi:hypothetical protein
MLGLVGQGVQAADLVDDEGDQLIVATAVIVGDHLVTHP